MEGNNKQFYEQLSIVDKTTPFFNNVTVSILVERRYNEELQDYVLYWVDCKENNDTLNKYQPQGNYWPVGTTYTRKELGS